MGNLITKDGVGVNVGLNREDFMIAALGAILVGIIVSVASAAIIKAIL